MRQILKSQDTPMEKWQRIQSLLGKAGNEDGG